MRCGACRGAACRTVRRRPGPPSPAVGEGGCHGYCTIFAWPTPSCARSCGRPDVLASALRTGFLGGGLARRGLLRGGLAGRCLLAHGLLARRPSCWRPSWSRPSWRPPSWPAPCGDGLLGGRLARSPSWRGGGGLLGGLLAHGRLLGRGRLLGGLGGRLARLGRGLLGRLLGGLLRRGGLLGGAFLAEAFLAVDAFLAAVLRFSVPASFLAFALAAASFFLAVPTALVAALRAFLAVFLTDVDRAAGGAGDRAADVARGFFHVFGGAATASPSLHCRCSCSPPAGVSLALQVEVVPRSDAIPAVRANDSDATACNVRAWAFGVTPPGRADARRWRRLPRDARRRDAARGPDPIKPQNLP